MELKTLKKGPTLNITVEEFGDKFNGDYCAAMLQMASRADRGIGTYLFDHGFGTLNDDENKTSTYYLVSGVETSLKQGFLGRQPYSREHILTHSVVEMSTKSGWRMSCPNGKKTLVTKSVTTVAKLFDIFDHDRQSAANFRQRALKCPVAHLTSFDDWITDELTDYAQSLPFHISEPSMEAAIRASRKYLTGCLKVNHCNPFLEEIFCNYIPGPGLCDPWLYICQSKSGTMFHFEDFLLDSININHGPGTKVWYTVAREDLPKVFGLYGGNPINGCGHQFYHKSYSPTVATLLAADIQVHCYIQEPGMTMFLEGGTLHSVVNIGASICDSRNFAGPRWLELSQVAINMHAMCTAVQNPASETLFEWIQLLDKRLRATTVENVCEVNRERLGEGELGKTTLDFRKRFSAVASETEVVCDKLLKRDRQRSPLPPIISSLFDDFTGQFVVYDCPLVEKPLVATKQTSKQPSDIQRPIGKKRRYGGDSLYYCSCGNGKVYLRRDSVQRHICQNKCDGHFVQTRPPIVQKSPSTKERRYCCSCGHEFIYTRRNHVQRHIRRTKCDGHVVQK